LGFVGGGRGEGKRAFEFKEEKEKRGEGDQPHFFYGGEGLIFIIVGGGGGKGRGSRIYKLGWCPEGKGKREERELFFYGGENFILSLRGISQSCREKEEDILFQMKRGGEEKCKSYLKGGGTVSIGFGGKEQGKKRTRSKGSQREGEGLLGKKDFPAGKGGGEKGFFPLLFLHGKNQAFFSGEKRTYSVKEGGGGGGGERGLLVFILLKGRLGSR